MISHSKRGRPTGSGKDDRPYLAKVADQLVADPRMKPTTAMRRVMATRKKWSERDETLIRRWQVKWQADGAALLKDARERAEAAAVLAASTSVPSSARLTGSIGIKASAIADLSSAIANSSYARLMREVENSPMMKMTKLVRALEESPMRQLEKALQDLINPPYLRQFREQQRMLQALADPLHLRSLRGDL